MVIQYNGKRCRVLRTKVVDGIKIYTVRSFKSYINVDVAFVNGTFVDVETALKLQRQNKVKEFNALITTLSFAFDRSVFLAIQKQVNDFRFLFLLLIF